MIDLAAEAALQTENDELRRALQTAQRAARRKELATEELVAAVYQAAKDAHLAHGPAPKITAPAKDRRTAKAEGALLHLTDWQVGKTTVSYNMEVARRRIGQAVLRAAELAEVQRSHHPVPDCHVMLGGDMVEGVAIFPGQAFEVEAGAFEQLVAVAGMIESSVTALLGQFERVHVWEELGNHGRLGRKGDHPGGDNIDRMAYTLARTRLSGHQRLIWHPYDSSTPVGTHVVMGNYHPFLFHGDEIKSFGGNTPAFGLLRKLTAWASGVLAPFQDAYGGHFHTPMTLTMPNGARIFMSGSPESDNVYAAEFVAAKGHPSQRLNFVDPVAGRVTAEYTLWLD